MMECLMWLCHSVYRETARVKRMISLLDFLTSPAAICNSLWAHIVQRLSQSKTFTRIEFLRSTPDLPFWASHQAVNATYLQFWDLFNLLCSDPYWFGGLKLLSSATKLLRDFFSFLWTSSFVVSGAFSGGTGSATAGESGAATWIAPGHLPQYGDFGLRNTSRR